MKKTSLRYIVAVIVYSFTILCIISSATYTILQPNFDGHDIRVMFIFLLIPAVICAIVLMSIHEHVLDKNVAESLSRVDEIACMISLFAIFCAICVIAWNVIFGGSL